MFCSPGPYGASVPPEYRGTREPDAVYLVLYGTWDNDLPRDKTDLLRKSRDRTDLTLSFRLDDGKTRSATWHLSKMFTSTGGYALSLKDEATEEILQRMIDSDHLLIGVPQESLPVIFTFDLKGLGGAVERVIACYSVN